MRIMCVISPVRIYIHTMALTRSGRRMQKKRASKPYRRRAAARIRRSVYPAQRTFTEVYDGGTLSMNTGSVFSTSFNSIPQAASYAELYRQFCIKKLQVMLLPLYTDAEVNTSLGTLGYQATRVAFAITDTPNQVNPTSELDVLTENGAKVVLGHKKIVMTCYPKPYITNVVPGVITNDYVAVRQKKAVWLNTKAFGQTNDGQDVVHGGISFWISNNLANLGVECFKIYYKVWFAMRDPA